jgi:tRNA-dihydrouridine synthase B
MLNEMRVAPDFWVGSVPVFGDLILAPMDGLSDLPFRQLAHFLGSSVSYTEFINAVDVIHGHPYLEQRLAYSEDERPLVYQLLDDDPARLLHAALILRRRNPDMIDINMGCYARTVVSHGAGAALMRDPQKIGLIFKQLSQALDIPITGKIRLGWDDSSQNYLDVARAVEDNGGKLLAVHGRTRKQAYSGHANWDAIARIKEVLSIPVIGNGDVQTVADIEQIKAHTRCDAVMIGRAAVENPWIFGRKNRQDVTIDIVYQTMVQHLNRMMAFYGAERGLIQFRKFSKKYLAPYQVDPALISHLLTREQAQDFMAVLDGLVYNISSEQMV